MGSWVDELCLGCSHRDSSLVQEDTVECTQYPGSYLNPRGSDHQLTVVGSGSEMSFQFGPRPAGGDKKPVWPPGGLAPVWSRASLAGNCPRVSPSQCLSCCFVPRGGTFPTHGLELQLRDLRSTTGEAWPRSQDPVAKPALEPASLGHPYSSEQLALAFQGTSELNCEGHAPPAVSLLQCHFLMSLSLPT